MVKLVTYKRGKCGLREEAQSREVREKRREETRGLNTWKNYGIEIAAVRNIDAEICIQFLVINFSCQRE